MAETIARALRESGYGGPALPASTEQIQALADQVEALTEEVRRLKDVREFDEKLLESKEE